jgi:hypothetical protein
VAERRSGASFLYQRQKQPAKRTIDGGGSAAVVRPGLLINGRRIAKKHDGATTVMHPRRILNYAHRTAFIETENHQPSRLQTPNPLPFNIIISHYRLYRSPPVVDPLLAEALHHDDCT